PGIGGLRVSAAQLQAALAASLRIAARAGASDPFGFGTSWTDWVTTTRGIGLSVMASQVAHLTGDTRAAPPADAWMGTVLAASAWVLSLIVRGGASLPQCLQHQGANLLGSLDGSGVVLVGAAVEGPNATRSVVGGRPSGSRACPAGGGDRLASFDGNGSEF